MELQEVGLPALALAPFIFSLSGDHGRRKVCRGSYGLHSVPANKIGRPPSSSLYSVSVASRPRSPALPPWMRRAISDHPSGTTAAACWSFSSLPSLSVPAPPVSASSTHHLFFLYAQTDRIWASRKQNCIVFRFRIRLVNYLTLTCIGSRLIPVAPASH